MTVRINARLDADLARKVRALCQRTGRSTTEIVKESLEAKPTPAEPTAPVESISPPAAPEPVQPWGAFKVCTMTRAGDLDDRDLVEGRGVSIQDAIRSARRSIRMEAAEPGMKPEDRIIIHEDRILARVLAADVTGPPVELND